jgi:hypothetical protein
MYVSLWKRAALCLACFGMMIPQGALVAAAEKPQQQTTARMLDVKLTDGSASGLIVDAQGKVLKGAKIALRYQNRVVAQTTTNADGRFAITGLIGGVHELETVNGRVPARLWTEKTAPASAKPVALIVSDKNVIRAQCGEGGCGVGGGGLLGHGGGGGILGHGGGGNGWVVGNSYGDGGALNGGFSDGGFGNGGFGDGGFGYGAECYDYGYAPAATGGGFFGGGTLLTGLAIAGIVTAIAVAADDDDGRRRSP